MNEFIFYELQKCKVANIPDYDESSQELFIKKINKPIPIPTDFIEGERYIIEIDDYILNPPENFSLHTNWNNNIKPMDKVMQCIVLKIMGKMININSIGIDTINNIYTNNQWIGWLPRTAIKILKKVD